MAKTPKYYSIDNILKRDSEYNIILGQRSNGKSYAVKNHCIKKAWDDSKSRFIVLRRLAEEKNVGYLDVAAVMKNEQGCLPDDASADGVHPGKAYCQKWADLIAEQIEEDSES